MRLKNVSGEDLDLPTLDLRVPAGDEADVTGDDAKNLLASGQFERTDTKPNEKEK